MIKTAASKISLLYPQWEYIAAKLYLLQLYKETWHINNGYYPDLKDVIEKGIHHGIYNKDVFTSFTDEEIEELDSHISVDALEELRLLEYGQRLVHRQRNIACTNDMPHVGHFLYQNALSGGQQALGQKVGSIQEDSIAQFLFLDDDLDIHANDDEKLLDHAVFSNHKINHKV